MRASVVFVLRIDLAKPQGGEIGIAVVVDEYYKVIGAVTDGDIRRAVCKELDFSAPVSERESNIFLMGDK